MGNVLKGYSRRLLFVFLTNLLASATAQHWCYKNGNYTSNSPYRSNLEALLSSLSKNVDSIGFYNASVGQSPDTVYASVFCRADAQVDTCRSCIQEATTDVVTSCPNYKKAVRFMEFCTLRYSDESMFGIMETEGVGYWSDTRNASGPDRIQRDVPSALFQNLGATAASGGSRLKLAAADEAISDSQTVFMLVQCSPDLSSRNCNSCLTDAASKVLTSCDVEIGCRALFPNCNVRYEVNLFYNITRLLETAVTEASQLTLPLPPTPPPPLQPGKRDKNTSRTIIIVIPVSTAACLILAACSSMFLLKRIKRKSKEDLEIVQEISANTESLQYDFGKIKAATGDFSEAKMLGQGGFGNVYKGSLSNGQELAVKRLSWDSKQGDVEFKNEVLLMARLQHRNLVRLLGFSIQGKEKLLVYEFVKNASLDKFIFDSEKSLDMGWDQRYKIIMGIAKGLIYLHEESRLKIIHRDLKPSNVLLDGDMNPKIADFGLARLFLTEETEGITKKIVGTYGYMAPEYAIHGKFSVKSDVFSFGVLVLEIIRGQRNNSIGNGENVEYLSSLAWKHWCKGTSVDLIDPMLRTNSDNMNHMSRCIHIGLLCVQENPAYRPTMSDVVQMISNSNINLPVPSQPAFFVPSSSELDVEPLLRECTSKDFESSKSCSDNKADEPLHSSKNDLTITELHPR